MAIETKWIEREKKKRLIAMAERTLKMKFANEDDVAYRFRRSGSEEIPPLF